MDESMTQEEIYESFGLEPPAPAEEPAPASEPEAPAEAPTEVPTEESQAGEQPPAAPEPSAETEPPAQSDGTTPAKSNADLIYELAFAGKLNPFTGQPIRTKADYEAFAAQAAASRAEKGAAQPQSQEQAKPRWEDLQGMGIDPAVIESVVKSAVENHPDVIRARQAADAVQAQQQEALMEKAGAWLEEQIKEINGIDPAAKVKDPADLESRDPAAYAAMLERVRRGATLAEAYKLQYFDQLLLHQTNAAAQRVLNQDAGKAHLQAVGGRGGEGSDAYVPEEARRMLLELDPDMTDAQIRKSYAAFRREAGS